MNDLRTRLAHVADRSTLVLTHRGRRSGKAYDVTIWFLVEGETVYLATANRERQWVRNVLANGAVTLRVGDATFTGRVEPVTDAAAVDHVVDLITAKYWYTRPVIWLTRLLGRQMASATFRVALDGAHP